MRRRPEASPTRSTWARGSEAVFGRRGGRRAPGQEPATALARYALLEASGDYHDGMTARSREVLVKFGRASLTLSRFDETPVTHWALASLRALDGPQGGGVLRLTPDPESDERLTLRDPAMIEAIRAVCPDLDRAPPLGRSALRIGAWAGGAVGALALIVFVLVPALADRLAPLVPYEQELRLGEAVVEQIDRVMAGGAGFCEDPAGRAALRRLSDRLMPHAELPMPARLQVLNSPNLNAFAAPGGQVVILSGLLENAASVDEVAAVLAHELGHVAARDPLRGALRAAGSAGILGLVIGDVLGGTIVVAVGDAMINAAYTREAEEAADAYAHALLARAGLPSRPMAMFFRRLANRVGAAPGLLDHLRSHPDFESRIDAALAADTVGDRAFQPALTDADWVALQQICE